MRYGVTVLIVNASDALQGAVPGLFVSMGGNAPGTSKSFQIRGAYSVGVKNSDGSYGNTIKPLVLIDNVEGDLDMVNPERYRVNQCTEGCSFRSYLWCTCSRWCNCRYD